MTEYEKSKTRLGESKGENKSPWNAEGSEKQSPPNQLRTHTLNFVIKVGGRNSTNKIVRNKCSIKTTLKSRLQEFSHISSDRA